MKNVEMAKSYISRARWYIREAKVAFDGSNHPICVRWSQEALELATKALLRYLAIEYPREHDVGEALGEVENKLPKYLRERLPELKELLRELAGARGPAFYGLEREHVPPEKIFTEDYARGVSTKAEEMIQLVQKFVSS